MNKWQRLSCRSSPVGIEHGRVAGSPGLESDGHVRGTAQTIAKLRCPGFADRGAGQCAQARMRRPPAGPSGSLNPAAAASACRVAVPAPRQSGAPGRNRRCRLPQPGCHARFPPWRDGPSGREYLTGFSWRFPISINSHFARAPRARLCAGAPAESKAILSVRQRCRVAAPPRLRAPAGS